MSPRSPTFSHYSSIAALVDLRAFSFPPHTPAPFLSIYIVHSPHTYVSDQFKVIPSCHNTFPALYSALPTQNHIYQDIHLRGFCWSHSSVFERCRQKKTRAVNGEQEHVSDHKWFSVLLCLRVTPAGNITSFHFYDLNRVLQHLPPPPPMIAILILFYSLYLLLLLGLEYV